MYLMNELENIIDSIVVQDEAFFNEEEEIEMYITCLHMMEYFIHNNPKIITETDFNDIFDDNIYTLIHSMFEDHLFYTDDAEDEIDIIIEHAKQDFFDSFIPPRHHPISIILNTTKDHVPSNLHKLQNMYQPEQRTPDWYTYRHNLITASNAYKAFESPATQNQLIYEKCQPILSNHLDENSASEHQFVNTSSPLHWGQKYEPLSAQIYESTYNTTIEDFGCIKHDNYRFLGASPDGINVEPSSERYGRLLEIKNTVSREIDGVPKKEYWIQMQLQMEVCNLDECDFLETKFTEYTLHSEFQADSQPNNICVSIDGKTKGIIIHFHTISTGKPMYIYKPLDIITEDECTRWCQKIIEEYRHKLDYSFITYLYWKLEVNSCVLVVRNKKWFTDNVHELASIWDTIEKERVDGYHHRAPNRKPKKENDIIVSLIEHQGCLLTFNNVIKIHVNKIDNSVDDNSTDDF